VNSSKVSSVKKGEQPRYFPHTKLVIQGSGRAPRAKKKKKKKRRERAVSRLNLGEATKTKYLYANYVK
jgi:hypothetical protein